MAVIKCTYNNFWRKPNCPMLSNKVHCTYCVFCYSNDKINKIYLFLLMSCSFWKFLFKLWKAYVLPVNPFLFLIIDFRFHYIFRAWNYIIRLWAQAVFHPVRCLLLFWIDRINYKREAIAININFLLSFTYELVFDTAKLFLCQSILKLLCIILWLKRKLKRKRINKNIFHNVFTLQRSPTSHHCPLTFSCINCMRNNILRMKLKVFFLYTLLASQNLKIWTLIYHLKIVKSRWLPSPDVKCIFFTMIYKYKSLQKNVN